MLHDTRSSQPAPSAHLLTCFFRLSVIPTSSSSARGNVCVGSNSRTQTLADFRIRIRHLVAGCCKMERHRIPNRQKTSEMKRERGLLSNFLITIEVVHQMCKDAPGAKSQTCALRPQQSTCEAITHLTHLKTQAGPNFLDSNPNSHLSLVI